LLDLLDYAVSEIEARQMLSYLARKGEINRSGQGANTQISILSLATPDVILDHKIKLSQRKWNGTWNLLVYDIPESYSRIRMRLVRLLHQMGYAKQSASSWLSPYDWSTFLDEHLRGWTFGGTVSFLRGAELLPLAGDAPGDPASLWDLHSLVSGYRAIAAKCRSALSRPARAGAKRRIETAIWARREMALLVRGDPMLPPRLLPADWPRQAAENGLAELRERLNRDAREGTG